MKFDKQLIFRGGNSKLEKNLRFHPFAKQPKKYVSTPSDFLFILNVKTPISKHNSLKFKKLSLENARMIRNFVLLYFVLKTLIV